MYCINCGVELADSEKKCPLCNTVVYHPDIKQGEVEKPYPEEEGVKETVSPLGLIYIITMMFSVPLILTAVTDLSINGQITWSGYAVGMILLIYISVILPFWFKRPNPVIFVSIDFIALGVYLLYISLSTKGGWFLSFAFPVLGGMGLIVITVITLIRYIKRGHFFIFGGALIALGNFMLLVEFLINITFNITKGLRWSFYPLIVCCLMGIALIVIGSSKTLRESLYKKFFI